MDRNGTENTGKIKQIISNLRKNKQLEQEFHDKILSSYGINGKSMSSWQDYVKVKLPPDANPSQCREALIDVIALTDEISRYLRDARVVEAMAKTTYEREFDDAFAACYEEAVKTQQQEGGKRLPAKDTLERLADAQAKELKYGLHHAQVATMYFREILNKLNAQREDIKSILIALGIEQKAVSSGTNKE